MKNNKYIYQSETYGRRVYRQYKYGRKKSSCLTKADLMATTFNLVNQMTNPNEDESENIDFHIGNEEDFNGYAGLSRTIYTDTK